MAAKVEKTRGSGTFSEAGFWGMIRAALRQKSRWWKPVADVKLAARRTNQSANKRLKYEYQCAQCKNWFSDKEVEVDHKIEAGSLRNGDDLKGFVERLFCEKDGLQVLCKDVCHREKTNKMKKSS